MAPQSHNYRRVSYVIPLPTENPPRLLLPPLGAPRNGSIRPLLVPASVSTSTFHSEQPSTRSATTKAHPRHRLGVSSLALDTSTQLAGKSSPEGILYSGGRDGQIVAWDLRLQTKKRVHRYGYADHAFGWRKGRWEILTGWSDGMDEEEEPGEDAVGSDGDILGDVIDSGGRKRRKSRAFVNAIPYEQTWELDADGGPTPPSAFRQCIQTHTDWVNDILLCNLNQTVVSASSDGSIKAWSPHLSNVMEPALVGMHDDYVKCLTASLYHNWIASGSFDRTIKLWDISRTVTPPSAIGTTPARASSSSPLSTLSLSTSSQKSSVYALATDELGSIIASGSPERVVRMWDPRTGKRTGKLVGHTDIIRAVILSADGRYLLTGSADASIKLWSLAAQRCLHTFAHHTDSVWSLSSQHPSLGIFYSGDRSGIVSRVDMEGCNTVEEGECLVVCNATRNYEEDSPMQDPGSCGVGAGFRLQDSTGVNKLVALDDRLVWTATGSSSINRWKAPLRRILRIATNSMVASPDGTTFPNVVPNSRRTSESSDVQSLKRTLSLNADPTHKFPDEVPLTATSPATPHAVKHFSISTNFPHPSEDEATHLFGIPYQSLVRLVSPNEAYALGSLPSGRVRRHTSRDAELATLYSAASIKSVPMSAPRRSAPPLPPASVLRPSFRQDTRGTITSRLMVASSETQEENWSQSPRAQYEDRDLAAAATPLETHPDDIIQGEDGLVRALVLNDRMHVLTVNTAGFVGVWDIARCRCVGWFDRTDIFGKMGCGNGTDGSSVSEPKFLSPREILEMVRERIEGESVIAPWAAADTRVGNLTVHLLERCFDTEIYADEAGYGSERKYDTEQRLNVAKWILANLFEKFVHEELRKLRRQLHSISQAGNYRAGSQDSRLTSLAIPGVDTRHRSASVLSRESLRSIISSIVADPFMTPVVIPDMSLLDLRRASTSLSTPLIPIVTAKDGPLSASPQSPSNLTSANAMPTPKPRRDASDTSSLSKSTSGKEYDHIPQVTRRLSATSTPDDFSSWGSPGTPKDKDKEGGTVLLTPNTPITGGFMGRFRHFGRSSKRPVSGEIATSPGGSLAPRTNEGTGDSRKEAQQNSSEPATEQSQFLGTLSSQTIHPPSTIDAPPLKLPPDTEIILAEETQSGWKNVYRGIVGTTGADATVLEKIMPLWLLQYLLTNKIPVIPSIKVSFGVAPWPGQGGATPESPLTANRYLRVRKILAYVQEKIDNPTSRSTSRSGSISGATPRSSSDATLVGRIGSVTSHTIPTQMAEVEGKKPGAENVYEALCNDVVLPLDMTLASIRHYIWRSSSELVLFYRRKT